MNNYNKTELVLDGLDVQGLYLKDVFSVWQHYDRQGSPYFTVFMIDNSRITVAATVFNTAMLAKTGHGVCEFVVVDGLVREMVVSTSSAGSDQPTQIGVEGADQTLFHHDRVNVASV